MNIVELVKKAEDLKERGQHNLAFRTYLVIIDYYRQNKKSIDVCYELLLAYNNAVVLGMYLAESRDDLIKMSNLAKELIRVSRKSDNSEIYAIACFHAGVIGNALQDYKNAIKHLEEALTVFEIIGHDEGLMLACKNLAEAYRGIGQRSKAEMYQNRAEAISKTLKTNTTLSETTFWLKKWRSLPWVIKR